MTSDIFLENNFNNINIILGLVNLNAANIISIKIQAWKVTCMTYFMYITTFRMKDHFQKVDGWLAIILNKFHFVYLRTWLSKQNKCNTGKVSFILKDDDVIK